MVARAAKEEWKDGKARYFWGDGCTASKVCLDTSWEWIQSDASCYSYQSGVPQNSIPVLISHVKSYISISDILLLSHALSILALLLELSPLATFPEVERDILAEVYVITRSPLLSGAGLESMLAFFAALVQADNQIATHVVANFIKAADKGGKGEASLPNVAKCISQVVKSSPAVAAGTIAECSKHLKVDVYFCVYGPVGFLTDTSSTLQKRNLRKSSSVCWSLVNLAVSCTIFASLSRAPRL